MYVILNEKKWWCYLELTSIIDFKKVSKSVIIILFCSLMKNNTWSLNKDIGKRAYK